jgi:hypothetical protein
MPVMNIRRVLVLVVERFVAMPVRVLARDRRIVQELLLDAVQVLHGAADGRSAECIALGRGDSRPFFFLHGVVGEKALEEYASSGEAFLVVAVATAESSDRR